VLEQGRRCSFSFRISARLSEQGSGIRGGPYQQSRCTCSRQQNGRFGEVSNGMAGIVMSGHGESVV
jgi:hypothetical protein